MLPWHTKGYFIIGFSSEAAFLAWLVSCFKTECPVPLTTIRAVASLLSFPNVGVGMVWHPLKSKGLRIGDIHSRQIRHRTQPNYFGF